MRAHRDVAVSRHDVSAQPSIIIMIVYLKCSIFTHESAVRIAMAVLQTGAPHGRRNIAAQTGNCPVVCGCARKVYTFGHQSRG